MFDREEDIGTRNVTVMFPSGTGVQAVEANGVMNVYVSASPRFYVNQEFGTMMTTMMMMMMRTVLSHSILLLLFPLQRNTTGLFGFWDRWTENDLMLPNRK